MTRRALRDGALLAAILAIAAFLRFDALGAPSLWLDEILGQQLTREMAGRPWWQWLTGLEPEHGPLYYATQLLSGGGETAARFLPALFGVIAVALVGSAHESLGAGAASALLLAASPLHVYYSREARPYALLIALTAALLLLMLRRAHLAAIGAVLVGLLYTTAVAAPVLASAAAAAFAASFATGDQAARRHDRITALMAVVALAFSALLYRGGGAGRTDTFPDLDGAFFAELARTFTVSAFGDDIRGRTVVALLALAAAGAIALTIRNRRAGAIVVSMTILPLVFSLAGLRLLDHWFAARYVSPAIVGFVLLAGWGIAEIGRLVRSPVLVSAAVAVVIAWQTWPVARIEPLRKLDWRGIAAMLREHVRGGDAVVTAENWSYVSLGHYYDPPEGTTFAHAETVEIGVGLQLRSNATWLLTAGYNPAPAVREWMCRGALLAANPLEGFRLHYQPSRAHFLRDRATPAELRALSAALADGLTLSLGHEENLLLESGWGSVEGVGGEAFRWAVGREASVLVPRPWRGRSTIRFRAMPLVDPSLPPQTLTLSVNGSDVTTIALAPGWRDYEIETGPGAWKEGLNSVFFRFARAHAPMMFDPRSPDARPLAAAFDWISFDAPPGRHDVFVPSMAVRAGGDRFPVEAVARLEPTRFPAPQLRRETVETLSGRLGFDPSPLWPRLRGGALRLEDIASSVAWGSDCEDDVSFLTRAFATLLRRAPNPIERADLLRRLRGRTAREDVAIRILNAGRNEFLATP